MILGQQVDGGSYVVDMAQAHRGLAETALGIGVDVSSRIGILYAPPAAWSHGYLWGADIADAGDAVAEDGETDPDIADGAGRERTRFQSGSHRRAPSAAARRSRSENTPAAVTSGPAPGPCTTSGLSR